MVLYYFSGLKFKCFYIAQLNIEKIQEGVKKGIFIGIVHFLEVVEFQEILSGKYINNSTVEDCLMNVNSLEPLGL